MMKHKLGNEEIALRSNALFTHHPSAQEVASLDLPSHVCTGSEITEFSIMHIDRK